MSKLKELIKLGYTISLKETTYCAYNKKTKHEVYSTSITGLYNYLLKVSKNEKFKKI